MADDVTVQVRGVISDLNRFVERAVTTVTRATVANLYDTNPVDTGWSRANWIPYIGDAPDAPVGRRNSQGVAQASFEQSSRRLDLSNFRLEHKRVVIANNVDYIVILNTSHTPGFVQGAIRKAISRDIRGFRG